MLFEPALHIKATLAFAALSFAVSLLGFISSLKKQINLLAIACHLFLGAFSLINLLQIKFELSDKLPIEQIQWILLCWLILTTLHGFVLLCLYLLSTQTDRCARYPSKIEDQPSTSKLQDGIESCTEDFDLTPQRINKRKTPSNNPTYPGEIFHIKG